MIQNNNLHPAICTVDDAIEECEHLSHSHHIFILPFRLGRIGTEAKYVEIRVEVGLFDMV